LFVCLLKSEILQKVSSDFSVTEFIRLRAGLFTFSAIFDLFNFENKLIFNIGFLVVIGSFSALSYSSPSLSSFLSSTDFLDVC
jgi:hypothetical protein